MTVTPVSRSCVNYMRLFVSYGTVPNIRSFSIARALKRSNNNDEHKKKQDSPTTSSSSTSSLTTSSSNRSSSAATTTTPTPCSATNVTPATTISDESLSAATTTTKFNVSDEKIPTESLSFLVANEKLDLLAQEAVAAGQDNDVVHNSDDDIGKANSKKSFVELLMDSPLIRLGDFSSSTLVGTITARVKDDLYIDYGGKFDCVCKVPKAKQGSNPSAPSSVRYRPGDEVIIVLKDHEMAARFMGYDKDMTLLESDARLVGLRFNPTQKPENVDSDRLVSDGGLV